jgi:hypothetical protein
MERQPVASPDSQGDSQALSDPILARLVKADFGESEMAIKDFCTSTRLLD